MQRHGLFQSFVVFFTVLCITSIFYFSKDSHGESEISALRPKILSVVGKPRTRSHQSQKDRSIASYSYQGPTQSVPRSSQLVRVEVIVRDSPVTGGVQIKSVDFNGQDIPLQPRDIFGNRGTGSFQVPPGQYRLHWVVQRDKLIWPRILTHEEEVNIDPRDLWLQIEIIGEKASIR